MHAIYKGHGSRTSMGAYRGITVLNIDAKVYVMLLRRRRRVDMEERMHDAQHGFVAAGAPQTASSTYAGWWSSPEPMLLPCIHTVFVDFSKAFDSVNHEALWEVLETRGIHPKLISLIKPLRG